MGSEGLDGIELGAVDDFEGVDQGFAAFIGFEAVLFEFSAIEADGSHADGSQDADLIHVAAIRAQGEEFALGLGDDLGGQDALGSLAAFEAIADAFWAA